MAVPSTIDDFLEVVVKSGVLEKEVLDPYLQQMRAAGSLPDRPKKLAAVLVRDGLLTLFQVGQFLQGKWRGFSISGKYKLLDHLGAGGMGNVFLCEHKSMRRRVAINVLPVGQAKDPAALERFYREARAVAALDHPNIVRAHDIDHDGRYHFLVLEYVEGASFQEIVKRSGAMDVTRAAHYVRQAALGLHHAHLAGVVHRDVKPGNLLLDRQGVVKILDMGLARFFHDDEDGLTREHDERNILGTADYLAPEQAINSHAVDIRADIYGLGATFYFLLAGKPPFGDGTVAQKLVWHQMREPEPIRNARPETPEGLANVLSRMMAKDREARYQTPAEVYEALAPWTQTPIPPPPEEEMPKSGRRLRSGAPSDARLSGTALPSTPWPAVAAPVFPSAEATSVLLPSTTSPQPAPIRWRDRAKAVVPHLRRPIVWGPAAVILGAVVCAIGSWMFGRLAVASDAARRQQVQAPAAPKPAAPSAPAAGDGQYHIKKAQYEAAVDDDGRLTSLRVRGVEFLASPVGLPRGSYLALEEGEGRITLGATAQAADVVEAWGTTASMRYEFSDGAVTCTASNDSDEPLSFFLLLDAAAMTVGDGRGTYRKTPLDQEEWAESVWYTSGSRLKISGGTRVWGSPDRVWQTWYAGLGPHETRRIVLEMGGVSSEEALAIEALNRPAVTNAQSYVCVTSLDDLRERVVFTSADRWDCPIWAPDGRSLLCNCKGKLYRLPLADGSPRDFSTGAASPGRDYAVTTDGRRLAFSGADGIYIVPAEGGEPAPILPKKQGYIHGWSPDGRMVYYSSARNNGPMAIYGRLADGGEETRLLTSAGWSDSPEASPDGKWIYYTSDKSGKPAIWRMPAAGAGPDDALAQQVTNDGYRDWFPHPSPDGRWLLFLSAAGPGKGDIPDKQDVVLRLMPLSGGPIRELARLTGGQGTINAPCWSPDGKRFAYVRYAPPPK